MAIGPPSEKPSTAGRRHLAADMTAIKSATRSSSAGSSVTGSDSPVPRLSNRTSRQNDDNERTKRR